MRDCTDISIVLDRSGSMSSVKNDTEGGLKTFLENQKKLDGECVVSLYQFDNYYETVFEAVPIKNIDSAVKLEPRGGTALLDAIGRTINSTGERLRKMKEQDRPNKVIFVIITDGEENSSVEFTKDQIKEMTERQENLYSWQFVYIGANQDAFNVGHRLGVKTGAILNYTANKEGTNSLYNSLDKNIRRSRSMDHTTYVSSVKTGAFFDKEDIDKQEAAK